MLLDVIDIDVIHVCFHEKVMVVAMVLPGAYPYHLPICF
jgi:hypothetical protein